MFLLASLSYKGDAAVFPSGNIYRNRAGQFSTIGSISQPAGDFGIKNIMAAEGDAIWRLHYDGTNLWLQEYTIAEHDDAATLATGRKIELSIPTGFTWTAGDFIDTKALPSSRALAIALGQWLWTVDITPR